MFIDLIYNLTLLIALSVVSGFIDIRWQRFTTKGVLLQGFLFGTAAVIGMLRPFVIESGLIFDGRSVLISLCGLFFGPLSAIITLLMTITCRIYQGGIGTTMGVLVITSSAIIGSVYHKYRKKHHQQDISAFQLLLFGIVVHISMLIMTLALPADKILPTLKSIALPVMLTYPLATILIGKILSDQESNRRYLEILQKSEETFKAIFNCSFQFISLLTPEGNIIKANQAVLSFFKIHNEDIETKPFWELAWSNDPSLSNRLLDSVKAAANGNFIRYEVNISNRFNQSLIIDFSLKPVFDSNGKVIMLIAEAHDISAIKQSDEDLLTLELQLLQSQKLESLGRLAGGIAHDFNNMLQTILGYADLAAESTLSKDPISKYILEIQKAGVHSAELTKQLLAFARKQTISPKVVDLNQSISNMLQMLRRLIGEDIKLVWSPAENLLKIRIDPTQLDQVLTNLIVNARDAIFGFGTISIRTFIAELDSQFCSTRQGFHPGTFVAISISDNGCGMDKETQSKIFEPFFTTKDKSKGSGLGLATVYGITKQNNGFIDVVSSLDHGTTFTIYIPPCETLNVEQVSQVPSENMLTGTETILLVEDEKALLEISKKFLEKLGYYVIAANGPEEAIGLAKKSARKPDLLMTDVIMPVMSGRDLWNSLLKDHPKLPCLYMSGYPSDVIANQGILEKDVMLLHKPFTIAELGKKLHEVFSSNI